MNVPSTIPPGKPRRTYHSEQRSAQARRTRNRIVAAAGVRFARDGYPATTMSAIAASAGVSVATIELYFGTKTGLLKASIDAAIAGDQAPIAVLDRPWAARAQATDSATAFLAEVARTLRPAMLRSAGLVLAVFEAAGDDPALQALADQISEQRAITVAWIVDGIRTRAALRAGVTRRHAIDQVWLMMDPAVYERLTRYRHWSPAHYERWFVDSITRLLLP